MRPKRKQRLAERFKARRQEASPNHEGESNWAISYGDMITLLLAFFVLFFNVDKSKSTELNRLVHLVDSEFNTKADDKEKRAPDSIWGLPAVDKNGTYVGLRSSLKNKFESAVTVDGNRIIIEFPNVSFFPSTSYQMSLEGKSALKRFAGIFKEFTGQMRLIVRGYTDNRPVKYSPKNPFKDNLELSAFRAISALRELEQEGIPFKLMRIGGYGETDKNDERSAKEQLKLDRKIVLVVEPLDATERNNPFEEYERTPATEKGSENESNDEKVNKPKGANNEDAS